MIFVLFVLFSIFVICCIENVFLDFCMFFVGFFEDFWIGVIFIFCVFSVFSFCFNCFICCNNIFVFGDEVICVGLVIFVIICGWFLICLVNFINNILKWMFWFILKWIDINVLLIRSIIWYNIFNFKFISVWYLVFFLDVLFIIVFLIK